MNNYYQNLTIVITTFNDANSIIPFLKNFEKQSILPEKLLIIDGGSTDSTVDIITNYSKISMYPIEVYSDGKRRNISEGINKGIKLIKTDWVLITGTGNEFNENFIKNFLFTRDNSNSKVFYCSIIGQNKTFFGKIFNNYFLRGNIIQDLDGSNHGSLIHKSIFAEHGYFWENFIYAGEDLEFFLRLKNKHEKMIHVKDAIAYWDTPQTIKDYLKKMKVNSIADWQILSKKVILNRILVQFISTIIFILLAITQPHLWILVFLIYLIIGYFKKTKNIYSITLGIINRFVMMYFYVQTYKYSKNEYHLNL